MRILKGDMAKTMKWILLWLMVVSACAAQTIRPVLSEYRNKAEGRFEVVNDMFTATNVVLEAKGFTVDEGGAIKYVPLPPEIKLKLSDKSFRLAPKAKRTITYSATAAQMPAWFVIYADVAGAPVKKTSGLSVQVMLPHTVYILPDKDADRQELTIASATFDPATKTLALKVTSGSANFARVELTQVKTNDGTLEARGFPVFPKSTRRIEIQVAGDKVPQKVTLQFGKFELDADVNRL